MGVIGAAFSACQLAGAPWLGGMWDHVGRKRVLLYSQFGGLVAWAIFAIALLVPHIEMFTLDNRITGHVVVLLPIILIVVSRSTDGLIMAASPSRTPIADATPRDDRKTNLASPGHNIEPRVL